MDKPQPVKWTRQVPRPPAPPPPPPIPQKNKSYKPPTEYNIERVHVLCWNTTPVDKLVNLAFDDLIRDEFRDLNPTKGGSS